MACCCSTSRSACRATTPCRRPSGCSTPRRRPHRHARPAGLRPAAAVLRRSHQVFAGQPRCRQALHRDAAPGRDDEHRRSRRRCRRARDVNVDRAAIDAAWLAASLAPIEQMPPMHSALKHQGRALYEYAREGIEVERAVRQITIHQLSVLEWSRHTLVLDVLAAKAPTCARWPKTSAPRSAAARTCRRCAAPAAAPLNHRRCDHARCARRVARRRTRCAPAAARCAARRVARTPLPAHEAARFLTGLRRRVNAADAPRIRVYGPEPRALLGSAHITAGELIPDRLLSPLEVQSL